MPPYGLACLSATLDVFSHLHQRRIPCLLHSPRGRVLEQKADGTNVRQPPYLAVVCDIMARPEDWLAASQVAGEIMCGAVRGGASRHVAAAVAASLLRSVVGSAHSADDEETTARLAAIRPTIAAKVAGGM